MAWSTTELAELAGTTVKTIRHYHSIGLLEEPERTPNGYKQYLVSHLVRLLQITRLTQLDVPLAQIAAMGRGDAEPDDALRDLDADLAATIDRLHRVRAELASILRGQSSTDLPTGFGPLTVALSEADRALILIYSRVFGPAEMQDLRAMVIEMSGDPVHEQFDSLPADADEPTRRALAERYAPRLRAVTDRYSWMSDALSHAPRGPAFAADTLAQALAALYNAAQLDVLSRVNRMRSADDHESSH